MLLTTHLLSGYEDMVQRENGVYHDKASGKSLETVISDFLFLKLCHRYFFATNKYFIKKQVYFLTFWDTLQSIYLSLPNVSSKLEQIKKTHAFLSFIEIGMYLLVFPAISSYSYTHTHFLELIYSYSYLYTHTHILILIYSYSYTHTHILILIY